MNQKAKTKILAVDDNRNNLIALEAVFYGSDYELVEANSGQEAIDCLKKVDDIALILLDVQMPIMDGFETAKHIKQMERCFDIPIIFITAFYREDPFVKKGYECGAVDYFGKPFDPDLLRKKVDIYSSFRKKNFLLRERETRIQHTEELLKTSRKLSNILEEVNVGVLISDANGELYQCNEPASQILNSAEAEGKDRYGEILSWWNRDGSIFKEKDGILVTALSEKKSTHNKILELRCSDGSLKRLLASASPLLSRDDKVQGAVIILADTSKSRHIEKEFEEHMTKLIAAELQYTKV